MKFNQNRRALEKQPCERDCPDRGPGCAVDCPRWAEYLRDRERDYRQRADQKRVSDAIHEGYRRLEKLKPGK